MVFTQAHNGTVQQIAAGSPVQVQLPAGPVQWEVAPIGRNAVLTARRTVASPGRVPGAVAVEVLDFVLPEPGRAMIVLLPVGGHQETAGPGVVDLGSRGGGGIHGSAFNEPFALTLDPSEAD